MLSVLISSGCRKETQVELCTVTAQKDLACNDQRLKKKDQKYFRETKKGDMVTNPEDYAKARKWCLDTYQKLMACKRRQ